MAIPKTTFPKIITKIGSIKVVILLSSRSISISYCVESLSRAISRMRTGEVIKQEGYDGEYGVIKLFKDSEKHELIGQKKLFKIIETKADKKPKQALKKTVRPKKKP